MNNVQNNGNYYAALDAFADGHDAEKEINKITLLMRQLGITPDYRRTTVAAKACRDRENASATAIELEDGTIITAHTGDLLGCSAALLINATKHLAHIDHSVKLLPQEMIAPIQHTKIAYLQGHNPRLHTDEVLVALSVLSQSDKRCAQALAQLPRLNGCQAHSTVMLSEVDTKTFRRLGIQITCEPVQKK